MTTLVNPRPKRLIVCCDGTWQSSISGIKNIPSNVTRLARSFAREGIDEDGKVWQQIVHYDAGIGAERDISKDERDRQGGFGVGFVGNVLEAYNFLVLNYAPGDKIFCFGFSRGAYTARAVAGLVNDIGIVAPRDMQDFPDLFTLYSQNKDSNGFRRSTAYREWVTGVRDKDKPVDPTTGLDRFIKPPHTPARECSREVEVVGVFDTVGSLGVPETPYVAVNLAANIIGWRLGTTKVGFHNPDLSPYIKNAFHALALDEHRQPFSPTLWYLPIDDATPAKPPAMKPDEALVNWKRVYHDKSATDDDRSKAWKQLIDSEMFDHLKGIDSRLLQVWFPGVHINIGGGNDDLLKKRKSDLEQIALVSFAWMCEQISPFLQLEEDIHEKAVNDRMYLVVPALTEISKANNKDFSSRSIPSLWKVLDLAGLVKAEVKKISNSAVYGWATGPIVDSFEGGVKLGGSKPRTPGRYTKGPKGEALGPTNEYIHPSVYYRHQKLPSYTPIPLRGFVRKQGKDRFEWVHETMKVTIPEYEIAEQDVFTRYVADQDSKEFEDNAAKFLKDTDEALAKMRGAM